VQNVNCLSRGFALGVVCWHCDCSSSAVVVVFQCFGEVALLTRKRRGDFRRFVHVWLNDIVHTNFTL